MVSDRWPAKEKERGRRGLRRFLYLGGRKRGLNAEDAEVRAQSSRRRDGLGPAGCRRYLWI